MNRRQFLSTLTAGTLGLAGCTARDDDDQVRTVTVTVTRTPSTTTETEIESTTNASTTSELETTQTETTTEPQTTAPEERAGAKIEDAKARLAGTITTFENFGGEVNASLLNVTAATTSFDRSAIEDSLSGVRSTLSSAESDATDQQVETIEKLREIKHFLENAALAQEELLSSYEAVTNANDAFRNARWSDVNRYGNEARKAGMAAEPYVSTIKSGSTAASTTALEALPKSTYNEKVAQLQTQAVALRTLGKQFKRVQTASLEYDNGLDAYYNQNYRKADGKFSDGQSRFGSVVNTIDDQAEKSPVNGIYSDVNCFSSALKKACKQFKKAARAGDEETRQEHDEKAGNALRSCSVVQDVLGEIN